MRRWGLVIPGHCTKIAPSYFMGFKTYALSLFVSLLVLPWARALALEEPKSCVDVAEVKKIESEALPIFSSVFSKNLPSDVEIENLKANYRSSVVEALEQGRTLEDIEGLALSFKTLGERIALIETVSEAVGMDFMTAIRKQDSQENKKDERAQLMRRLYLESVGRLGEIDTQKNRLQKFKAIDFTTQVYDIVHRPFKGWLALLGPNWKQVLKDRVDQIFGRRIFFDSYVRPREIEAQNYKIFRALKTLGFVRDPNVFESLIWYLRSAAHQTGLVVGTSTAFASQIFLGIAFYWPTQYVRPQDVTEKTPEELSARHSLRLTSPMAGASLASLASKTSLKLLTAVTIFLFAQDYIKNQTITPQQVVNHFEMRLNEAEALVKILQGSVNVAVYGDRTAEYRAKILKLKADNIEFYPMFVHWYRHRYNDREPDLEHNIDDCNLWKYYLEKKVGQAPNL